jgi:hypothetical protein
MFEAQGPTEQCLLPRATRASRGRAISPLSAARRGRSVWLRVWTLAVAGDVSAFLLGRRLGGPFLRRHARRLRVKGSTWTVSTGSSPVMAARPSSSGASSASCGHSRRSSRGPQA